ncbi:type II secretion system secretin GspD [Caulobacter segnis]|uniref:type II secretion system secretin GspD n=1 Tax=Caulobacter segnis TaxID=88688 RepID=UPI0028609A2F|nr:type II secretion system secretin GspD [Caulobacter segnis]MDR6624328.1 general secretion pathway protein D [Caulobacter segnis]
MTLFLSSGYSIRSAMMSACGALALQAAGLVAALPDVAWAQAVRADQEASYSFAFQDADVGQAAREVLDSIGVAYTIDPSVSGKISFRIEQRLTKAQLLQAFEAALAANDIALVRNGDSLIVTAKARARSVSGLRSIGDSPRSLGYEVVAVPLSFAVPTEVAKALDAISGKGLVLHADDHLGLIVLAGGGQELKSALDTLQLLDQSGLREARLRWFDLSNASAATVAGELEGMVKAAGISGLNVLPLKRLNGILVFGRTEKALNDITPWVYRLDAPTKDTATSLWVYHPRNTSAESLGKTLNAVLGGQGGIDSSTTSGTPATRDTIGQTTVSAGDAAPNVTTANSTLGVASLNNETARAAVDKDTNTLLVSAPSWRWVQIQKILAELDKPQSQVLIEASVLEVTLGDNFKFGVDWSVLGDNGRIRATNTTGTTGTIGPTYPGFSITFLSSDFQAAINALGARTGVEVVSAPKIITLDNKMAKLQVGDQVPVVTQSSQSTQSNNTAIINNVDYRDSGVILSVTPRISGENRIILDVSQEVSSVIQTRSSGIDSPTIQQRKFQSTLTLRDGGVVALGGLISRTRNEGNSGVPVLKDIPGVGRLFKTATRDTARTELIVLLRARVMTEADQSDTAMRNLFNDMRELNARGLLDGGL